MGETEKFSLYMKELEFVQDSIARYDSNGLMIKSWCATTVSALAAYAAVHGSALAALVGIAATLAFSLMELIYRCYQSRFIARARTLEEVIVKADLSNYTFGLCAAASTADWPKEIRWSLRQPHFIGLYLVLALLSAVLTGAIVSGWFQGVAAPNA